MNITELIGRLHPLLVHLPIGIFTLLLIIEILTSLNFFLYLADATKFILRLGIITAILSLITGYILSYEGSNNQNQVDNHMWMAIATTSFYGIYFLWKGLIDSKPVLKWPVIAILSTSLVLTGHQGGVLTHGAGFLQLSRQVEDIKSWPAPVISDIEKANVYADLVQYTLNTKCVSCHGEEKQKGKLRLDGVKWIETAGKSGKSINRTEPESSELLKRILLEEVHDEHMPPKGKIQLNEFEKSILQWWVKTGASFDKTVSETGADSAILASISKFKTSLTKTTSSIKQRADVPEVKPTILAEIRKAGWIISPIAEKSNYLRATSYNLEMPVDQAVDMLQKAGNNIIELKLSAKGLNDNVLTTIATFGNLEKLWLDNNQITEKGFIKIENLSHLEFLNAASTDLNEASLKTLSKIKTLRKIIAVNTRIESNAFKKIGIQYPNLEIVLNDTMISLPSDTIFSKKSD